LSLIFYEPSRSIIGERLQERLEAVVSKEGIETHHTIDAFYAHLQKPICQTRVAVIFAAAKKDFDGILCLREFLSDIKLILVLSDDSPDMIAEAHTLRPRFITWADSDFQDIEPVLKRLMKLSENRFGAELESASCSFEKSSCCVE